MSQHHTLRQAVIAISLLFATSAYADTGKLAFDIPAEPLEQAVNHIAKQANIQVLLASNLINGKSSVALKGEYTAREALEKLLSGSGLSLQDKGNNSFIIIATPQKESVLPEISVKAASEKPLGSTTEGTQSYTTGATNTATRLSLSLRETPQSVSVITRQRLDDQNLTSIADALKQTAGLNVQNPGSDRLYVTSRGFAIDNYQFDGIPTTSFAFTQALPHGMTDMAIYDRIEVVRGATGLLTGAGDPSGVVNLVRKRPTDTFKAHAAAGIGSWDFYRAELDVSGPLNESGNLRGRTVIVGQHTNSFIDYLKQQKTTAYGILEADLAEHTLLTAGINYVKNNQDGFSTTGFPVFFSNGQQTRLNRSFNPASRDSSNDQEAINVFGSIDHTFSNEWKLKLALNHQYSTRDYDSVIVGTTTGFANMQTGDGLRYTATKGDNWQKQSGLDMFLTGPFTWLGRTHEFVAGLNYQEYENRRNGFGHLLSNGTSNNGVSGVAVNLWQWNNNAPQPTYSMNREDDNIHVRQNGVYLATRLKPSDSLSIILGSRLSNYQYDAYLHYNVANMTPYNTDDKVTERRKITPYAGIVYDLNENHSAYASYTSIFKPQPYKNRNARLLNPREGDNYEVGFKSEYFERRLNTAISLFEIRLDNDAIPDGNFIVPGTDFQAAYVEAKTKTTGIDMEISGELTPDWQITASYTHSITKDANHDRVKTNIPADQFKLWTSYRLAGPLNRLTIGGGVNWQSAMHYAVSPWQIGRTVQAKQEDFAVVNLMARYQLSPQWTMTATINNLLDKKYISSLDTNFNSAFYGEPRSVFITTKYDF